MKLLPILCSCWLITSAAHAEDVVRLSPEERLRVLDAAAAGPGSDALEGAGSDPRRVHGEVGMMIGTGGTRGVYGAATVPLGQAGGATVGFEDYRGPHYRWSR